MVIGMRNYVCTPDRLAQVCDSVVFYYNFYIANSNIFVEVWYNLNAFCFKFTQLYYFYRQLYDFDTFITNLRNVNKFLIYCFFIIIIVYIRSEHFLASGGGLFDPLYLLR